MKEKGINNIKLKSILLITSCAMLFTIILINVLNKNIQIFDSSIYNIINSLKSDFFDMFFRVITRFADEEILILIALTCVAFIKNRRIGLSIAINLTSVGLINYILKEIVKRPRPPIEFRMVQESSYSFPSGHAMASLAFYGLIIYYLFKYIKNYKVKIISGVALGLLIFLIGLSRIYLGVHFASDVIAGFLISCIYIIIYILSVLKILKI